MNLIIDGDRGDPDGSIINVMRNDSTMKMFGLNAISKEPIAVSAIVLPQAKLRYGGGAIVDPMLSGTWNMGRKKFSNPPTNPENTSDINMTISVIEVQMSIKLSTQRTPYKLEFTYFLGYNESYGAQF